MAYMDYYEAIVEAAEEGQENDVENIARIVEDYGVCAVEVDNLINAYRSQVKSKELRK